EASRQRRTSLLRALPATLRSSVDLHAGRRRALALCRALSCGASGLRGAAVRAQYYARERLADVAHPRAAEDVLSAEPERADDPQPGPPRLVPCAGVARDGHSDRPGPPRQPARRHLFVSDQWNPLR